MELQSTASRSYSPAVGRNISGAPFHAQPSCAECWCVTPALLHPTAVFALLLPPDRAAVRPE